MVCIEPSIVTPPLWAYLRGQLCMELVDLNIGVRRSKPWVAGALQALADLLDPGPKICAVRYWPNLQKGDIPVSVWDRNGRDNYAVSPHYDCFCDEAQMHTRYEQSAMMHFGAQSCTRFFAPKTAYLQEGQVALFDHFDLHHACPARGSGPRVWMVVTRTKTASHRRRRVFYREGYSTREENAFEQDALRAFRVSHGQ